MYPFTFPSMAGSPFMMGSYSAPQNLFQAPMMSAPQQQPSMNYSQAMGGPQVQSILEALNQVRNRQMAGAGGGAPGGPTTGPMPSNMAGRLGAMTNPTGLPSAAAPEGGGGSVSVSRYMAQNPAYYGYGNDQKYRFGSAQSYANADNLTGADRDAWMRYLSSQGG